jgi:hypothetical protein
MRAPEQGCYFLSRLLLGCSARQIGQQPRALLVGCIDGSVRPRKLEVSEHQKPISRATNRSMRAHHVSHPGALRVRVLCICHGKQHKINAQVTQRKRARLRLRVPTAASTFRSPAPDGSQTRDWEPKRHANYRSQPSSPSSACAWRLQHCGGAGTSQFRVSSSPAELRRARCAKSPSSLRPLLLPPQLRS